MLSKISVIILFMIIIFVIICELMPEDDDAEEVYEKSDAEREREYNFVFEDYGAEKVKRWLSELDLFYYLTYQYDQGTWAQELKVNILCKDEKELYQTMIKLGITPEIHDVIDQENAWQYSEVLPNLVQPRKCIINDINCNVIIDSDNEKYFISISVFDKYLHEDLNEHIFNQAKRLQSFLKTMDFRFRRPEPDWDKRHIVSKETHPELWES